MENSLTHFTKSDTIGIVASPVWTLILSILLIGSLTAGPIEDKSNIACVERLQIPTYPALAAQARIIATITSTVTLGANASVERIRSTVESVAPSADKMFTSTTEEALRTSVFSKTCRGQSITLIFDFVLGDRLLPNRATQSVSFGYPNHFWIVAPPNLVNPESTPK